MRILLSIPYLCEDCVKSSFVSKKFTYDGSQLRPLYNYLEHKILGDSVVSWIGPCDIPFEHMIDGEDLLDQAEIRSAQMLHFIIEIFDKKLFSAVCLQRLFASLACDYLNQQSKSTKRKMILFREGDDIYFEKKKLSISIATASATSSLIHFAMNVTNKNTPVATLCLQDLGLKPEKVAKDLMKLLVAEYNSIVEATQKVRSY